MNKDKRYRTLDTFLVKLAERNMQPYPLDISKFRPQPMTVTVYLAPSVPTFFPVFSPSLELPWSYLGAYLTHSSLAVSILQ